MGRTGRDLVGLVGEHLVFLLGRLELVVGRGGGGFILVRVVGVLGGALWEWEHGLLLAAVCGVSFGKAGAMAALLLLLALAWSSHLDGRVDYGKKGRNWLDKLDVLGKRGDLGELWWCCDAVETKALARRSHGAKTGGVARARYERQHHCKFLD